MVAVSENSIIQKLLDYKENPKKIGKILRAMEGHLMYAPEKVAESIKNRAKERNIQIKDMLLDLGLNKNTLSTMYSGSMLKGDSLARIADYLDCSVDYLLGRTDNPAVNR